MSCKPLFLRTVAELLGNAKRWPALAVWCCVSSLKHRGKSGNKKNMWLNQLAIHDFSIAFLWISCGFPVDFHSFPVGFPGPFNVDAIAGGSGRSAGWGSADPWRFRRLMGPLVICKFKWFYPLVNWHRHCQRDRSTTNQVFFSRMRSKGSRFTLGVWGLRVCSLDVAFTIATVRNRSQPSATVRAIPVWPCLWEVLQRWSFLEVSDVSLLRFAWQAWHFVTFRRVLQRVENRFAWQAQYFCDVFRRCVAVFVAGAALWTCPSSFCVAGAAL